MEIIPENPYTQEEVKEYNLYNKPITLKECNNTFNTDRQQYIREILTAGNHSLITDAPGPVISALNDLLKVLSRMIKSCAKAGRVRQKDSLRGNEMYLSLIQQIDTAETNLYEVMAINYGIHGMARITKSPIHEVEN